MGVPAPTSPTAPTTPPAPPPRRTSLRHPAEIPVYALLVFLNLVIAVLIAAFVVIQFISTPLSALVIANATERYVAIALVVIAVLVALFFVYIRQTTRAAVRGSSVLATAEEFPEIKAIMDDATAFFGFRPGHLPEIYVTNGNGVLNAFAASAYGHDFVTVHAELFMNTLEENRKALRFIIGHELGHIRLSHTRLWYQLSIVFSSLIPLLGAYLSRLRELSCDRHGARFEPQGADGLVLLTAGRYIYHEVRLEGLLDQARRNVGFWNTVVQLPLSHPLTLRRIRTLSRLGMIWDAAQSPAGKVAPG
jgi:Zn-dependent protease with chaperone function